MADRTLKQLLARARAGSSRNTEAYLWLRPKFERLYPLLERRKLTFQEVADDLATGGIRGGRGKPLTADAARRIWNRIQRDVATEEPWRMAAARATIQHGGASHKPRTGEPERGKNADRPPPVVTAPAPSLPVPHYPPPPSPPPPSPPPPSPPPPSPTPPSPTPPAQSALNSRPNAPSKPGGAIQTPEEMRADIRATIKRRSQYF